MSTLDDDNQTAERHRPVKKTWFLLGALIVTFFAMSWGIRLFLTSSETDTPKTQECFAPLKCKQLPFQRAMMTTEGAKHEHHQ